jgi:gamma-glutamyltranspeptidase/glutathione hydrolase/leukotriene-C4 hydrolase
MLIAAWIHFKRQLTVIRSIQINLPFGSQVVDSKTGIILNDEMDDFSIPGVPNFFGLYPSPYNYIGMLVYNLLV